MNIAPYFSTLRARLEHYLVAEHHAQTSNTGLVAIVAICMIFVSFVSNKPGSMGPLLRANILNATSYTQEEEFKNSLAGQTLSINGVEYILTIKK